jgi:hypothetical protein
MVTCQIAAFDWVATEAREWFAPQPELVGSRDGEFHGGPSRDGVNNMAVFVAEGTEGLRSPFEPWSGFVAARFVFVLVLVRTGLA